MVSLQVLGKRKTEEAHQRCQIKVVSYTDWLHTFLIDALVASESRRDHLGWRAAHMLSTKLG